MENKSDLGSNIFSVISGFLLVGIVIGIPGYFLWNTIKDIFGDIPSNRSEFRRLLELSHGMIFYIFSGIVILWGVVFNVIYRLLVFLTLFLEESGWKSRSIALGIGLLFVVTGLLPYLSYFFISKSLYGYYFDFYQMLSFIGTFELMLIFVALFESFIGTAFISPIVRMIFYIYLFIQFV